MRGSSLARNSGWIFLGQGLSVICQGAYFVLLGRLLGSTEYGIYVGAVALALIVGRYSSLGSGDVFVRHVSPDYKQFAPYWGNIIMTTTSLGILFCALITWAGPYLAHSYSRRMLVCIAVGDCLCAQITAACARVFLAFEKTRLTASMSLLTNFLRALLAGGMLLLLHRATAGQWVVAALIVSLTAAVIALSLVTLSFGRARFSARHLRRHAGEGVVFALSSSTAGIYNDVDKAMLGHYGMNIANGIYTMAYRVVDMCTWPLFSIHTAAFPRFFVKGSQGIHKTSEYARKIVRRTAPFGLLAALGMFIAAPVIPHLVGDGFSESVEALRWLCLLPLFRSFQLSAGDALTGSGHQKIRLATQTIAAAFNFGINLVLIPRFSWLGAAWSSLMTDGGLAILNWSALAACQIRGQRREL